METDKKNPLDTAHTVALYRFLSSGTVMVSTYYGEHDAEYHPSSCRISEHAEVRFEPLQNDEVIRNAVAACDAAEKQAYRELNEKLIVIREQKPQLLALTHQPEVV